MNKRFSAVMLAFIVVALTVLWLENNIPEVTEYTFSSTLVSEELSVVKAVVVSDLHNKRMGFGGQKLLHAIKRQNPEVIFITGDIIDGRRKNFDKTREFVESIKDTAPIYYITGNHEYYLTNAEQKRLFKLLEDNGVVILNDQAREITLGNQIINVMGLKDLHYLYLENEKYYTEIGAEASMWEFAQKNADIAQELQKQNMINIILCHRPELFKFYKGTGNDLILSGHSHGGQIRAPFMEWLIKDVFRVEGWFPYKGGEWESDSSKLIVSRGIGNSTFPFRINNNPELVVISFEKS